MKKKILFFVTEDWYFLSHRIKLAKYLQEKGYQVSVCCKDTGRINELKVKGIICHNLNIKRKSLSLFQFLNELTNFIKTINKVKPNIIHLISLRTITIGILASLFVKGKFFATFTGMGFLFIKKGITGIILRKIITLSLRFCIFLKKSTFVVQNKDDQILFTQKFKFKKDMVKLIRGSGVDLDFYKYCPEIENKNIIITYAGRILEDKGVLFLIEAFNKAKKKCANIKLYIAGSLDEKNPTSIKKKYFDKLIKNSQVYYLGNVTDIYKLWRESNIAILLSKREGLPLSLLEAASVGRAIISSDVPGSREIAIDGYNSINVELGNIEECSKAIIKLTKNKKLREKYGKNSRKLVESDLALEHICDQYYRLYNN
tara:strand:+ start:554 stop:1669 length:1116 start_codon:yes stop_codon:yes gene_type:complete